MEKKIKVEPLQNGEREELEELLDIINWTSYVTVDIFEDKKTLPEQETEAGELIKSKARAFITKIKSQSKKEGREEAQEIMKVTLDEVDIEIEKNINDSIGKDYTYHYDRYSMFISKLKEKLSKLTTK